MLTIIKRLRHVAALELEEMLNKKLTHSDDDTRRESQGEEKLLVEVNLKLRHPHLARACIFDDNFFLRDFSCFFPVTEIFWKGLKSFILPQELKTYINFNLQSYFWVGAVGARTFVVPA